MILENEQRIKELLERDSDLAFNLGTITKNRGLRGVIFGETKKLMKQLKPANGKQSWEQLIDLIIDKRLDIQIELEELENNKHKVK